MATETLDVASMLPTQFEPKRKNRWILAIEGIDSYIVKTSGRPKPSVKSIEIPYMNVSRYVAGKLTWAAISIELYDPIAPSGAQQVMEWIRLHVESVSGRAGYADFYKRDVQLKLIDPVGTVIELWDIAGAQISEEVNFGDLTYEDDGAAQVIQFNIQPDNCVLQF